MCVILMDVRAVLIVNRKSDNYRLNIQGVKFWFRTNGNNGEEVYTKACIFADYYLYIQRIKDDTYIDYITNRIFTIKEEGDCLVLYPSGIKIFKERMRVYNNIDTKCMQIINSSENVLDGYYRVSEGILFDSYFCNQLAYYYDMDDVPADYVEAAMDYVASDYCDSFDKSRKLVQ